MATPYPDLLYILGQGSKWQDNEIRYSLRSVYRYFPHGRVVIVGDRPWFASDAITHLRAHDLYHENKLRNSIHKLSEAMKSAELGEEFVIMNDDFFFLAPFDQLPLYHRGPLRETIKTHPTRDGYYWNAKQIAFDKLTRRGVKDPLDYSLHFPMLFNRHRVREVLRIFGGSGHGYLFRTVYANWCGLGGELLEEKRGRCPLKLIAWNGPPSASFISTDGQVVMGKEFREWIDARFPKPSRYER